MKYLLSALLVLTICYATPAQVDGTDVSVKSVGGDADDDVLVPYELTTPFGPATLVVHTLNGWAMLTIPSIGVSVFAPLDKIPNIPGMREATVSGNQCIKKTYGGQSPHTGPLLVIYEPVVGNSGPTGSLSQAVADHNKKIQDAKEDGYQVGPCKAAQG